MADFILRGGEVRAGEPFADQVRTFKERYVGLLGALAGSGTEVDRIRTLEVDRDIAPYNFVRNARHVFVFPPQEIELHDKEGVTVGEIPGTAPYTLTHEAMVAEFDPAQVRGNIVLTYDDASDAPELRVVDQLEDPAADQASFLPAEARAAIEAAFAPVPTPSAVS